MASSERDGDKSGNKDAPPGELPAVGGSSAQMLDHSFTLQTMLSVKESVAALEAKTNRLISDVAELVDKLDGVRGDLKFFRGAAWVIGILVAGGWSAALYLLGKIVASH